MKLWSSVMMCSSSITRNLLEMQFFRPTADKENPETLGVEPSESMLPGTPHNSDRCFTEELLVQRSELQSQLSIKITLDAFKHN